MLERTKVLIFLALSLLAASQVLAKLYSLTEVKRVGRGVYTARDAGYQKIVIETRYCYVEAAGGEKATLKYDPYSYDNKIVFDRDSCDVKSVQVQK